MKASRFGWLVMLAGIALLSGMAHADSLLATFQVGGTNTCPNGSCLGGAYTLQFFGTSLSDSSFTAVLTATTPNGTSGSAAYGDYVSSVEFGDDKKISTATLTTVTTLTSINSASAGSASNWGTTVYGNLSNAGCVSGMAPNACNNQNLNNSGQYALAFANGSTYQWTWTVTYATPGLDTNTADMHIGLQYENANNTSNGLIVSEGSTQVPEPSSALLLASGFGGVGLWRRWRSWKFNI